MTFLYRPKIISVLSFVKRTVLIEIIKSVFRARVRTTCRRNDIKADVHCRRSELRVSLARIEKERVELDELKKEYNKKSDLVQELDIQIVGMARQEERFIELVEQAEPKEPLSSFTAVTSEGLTIDGDLEPSYNFSVFGDFGALDPLFWDL